MFFELAASGLVLFEAVENRLVFERHALQPARQDPFLLRTMACASRQSRGSRACPLFGASMRGGRGRFRHRDDIKQDGIGKAACKNLVTGLQVCRRPDFVALHFEPVAESSGELVVFHDEDAMFQAFSKDGEVTTRPVADQRLSPGILLPGKAIGMRVDVLFLS